MIFILMSVLYANIMAILEQSIVLRILYFHFLKHCFDSKFYSFNSISAIHKTYMKCSCFYFSASWNSMLLCPRNAASSEGKWLFHIGWVQNVVLSQIIRELTKQRIRTKLLLYEKNTCLHIAKRKLIKMAAKIYQFFCSFFFFFPFKNKTFKLS